MGPCRSSSDGCEGVLAREGYDPVYGARPLRRFVQREVETRIGRALSAGNIVDGSEIVVDLSDGELLTSRRPAGDETPAGALLAIISRSRSC